MRVHVIGAGVAGMAAAMGARASGARVVVHEATGHCGGRARSFFDEKLEREIDNGNHLMLSGNASALKLIDMLGARHELTGPESASFDFFEIEEGFRWSLELNDGPLPLWLFDAARRVPGTGLGDYLKGLKLPFAGEATAAALFRDDGALWRRFWEPFVIGVLNTSPEEASARLLTPVIAETLARGGRFSRPLTARRGLSHLFARPFEKAAARDRGLELLLSHGLEGVEIADGRIAALRFSDGYILPGEDDAIIFALPPRGARALIPALMAPGRFSAIVNVHFRPQSPLAAEEKPRRPLGVLGGVSQWIFTRGDIASVTISAADAIARLPAGDIAARVWPEVAAALEIDETSPPPFRVIKERRATFAATAAELARRAPSRTGLKNLFLAGDWVNTGLPATIEGAARSGFAAAALALA